jgi:hypothetical protein
MFSIRFARKTARKSTSRARRNRFRPQSEVMEARLVMTSLGSIASPVLNINVPSLPPAQVVNVTTQPVVTASLASIASTTLRINPPFSPPAQAVNLTTEPHDQVAGTLTASTTKYYSFQLQQGDYLQADLSVEPASGAHISAQMSILNASGTILDASTPDTPYGFYAPTSGTYYAEVTGVVSGLIPVAPYQLDLHRLALAQGTQNVSTLAKTGSMYAWLNGNTLDITGPTGYGFGITGNWTETTTRSNIISVASSGLDITGNGTETATTSNGPVAATYTASGTLELQTASGAVPLVIASGHVGTLTTAAQINGQVFGAVSSLNIPVTMNTGPTIAWVANKLGFNLNPLDENATFDLKIGGAAGIGLGNSAVLAATQAPVNNAVPYLYFTINPAGSTLTNIVSVVYDPADPALYVESGVPGLLPLQTPTINGLGYSQHGLIPYTPVDAPSQYTGTMAAGNVVLQGSFNTTGLTVVPSKVKGSITLNLDPKGTGKILGGTGVSVADLVDIFSDGNTTPLGNDLGQVFQNLSVGINGTLEINPVEDLVQWISAQGTTLAALSALGSTSDIPDVDLALGMPGPSGVVGQSLNYVAAGIGNPNSVVGNPQNLALLPIGDASLIYDGPAQSLYFRGGTMNPFAGTALASLTPLYTFLTETGTVPTLNVDVAIKPGGEVFLNVTSTSNAAGLPMSSQVLFAHDYPVTGAAVRYLTASAPVTTSGHAAPSLYTGIYLEADVKVLGNFVKLQGEMDGNGDFTLQATAQVNLGPLTGSATFTLSDSQAQGFSFTADVDASFSSKYIRGKADVDFTFGVADGNITYVGSVEASGQVYLGVWVGWSVSAGISSNGDIWVSADGYEAEFAI